MIDWRRSTVRAQMAALPSERRAEIRAHTRALALQFYAAHLVTNVITVLLLVAILRGR